jgi:hypothetical protein
VTGNRKQNGRICRKPAYARKKNRIVVTKSGDVCDFDIVEALEMKKGLQESLYTTEVVLTTI